jgi:molybdate transport system ATP-binding protein
MKSALSVDIAWAQDGQSGSACFDLPDGISVLIGRSGAGKSTLTRLILGLQLPTSGIITLGERFLYNAQKAESIPPHARRLGWVPQDAALFPHMSVEKNIAYGASKTADTAYISDVIELLSITPLKKRMPHTLSGGEARRVAIARAVTRRPALLVLDEPTTGLDARTKANVLKLIKDLYNQTNIPILMITHDYDDMINVADYAVLMDNNHIRATGTLEDISKTSDLFSALGLSERSSIISGAFKEQEGSLARITVDGQPIFVTLPTGAAKMQDGQAIKLRLRSRDISLSLKPIDGTSILNHLSGVITAITPHSENIMVTLQLENSNQSITAQITEKSIVSMQLSEGTPITALIKAVAIKDLA